MNGIEYLKYFELDLPYREKSPPFEAYQTAEALLKHFTKAFGERFNSLKRLVSVV